eukprot:SAG11_NODE_157_length_14147_cov_8.545202_4_plen_202_part_00
MLELSDGFETRFLNARTTPSMPIALAARASSAIPFFFEPVQWESRLFVDGGVSRNLPLDAFGCAHYSSDGDDEVEVGSSRSCDDFGRLRDRPAGAPPRLFALQLGADSHSIQSSEVGAGVYLGLRGLGRFVYRFLTGMRKAQGLGCDIGDARRAYDSRPQRIHNYFPTQFHSACTIRPHLNEVCILSVTAARTFAPAHTTP